MHLLCNFHTRACFPWQAVMALKPFISKRLVCDLDRFSKIQSQIMSDNVIAKALAGSVFMRVGV